MDIARTSSQNSLMDALDRVLDKGVVIDAWIRLSLIGIELVMPKTRVVVASIETYLHDSAGAAEVKSTARPRGEGPRRISVAESIGLAGAAVVPVPAHDRFPPPRISPWRVQFAPRMNT